MNKSKEVNNKQSLSTIYNGVFISKDAFGEIFNESINEKLLLCPVDGYFLTKKQYQALQKTNQDLGNDNMLISITEYEDMFSIDSEHWEIENDLDYEEYIKLGIFLENAIYSNKGWGILISHEEHAVIGGSSLFVETFKKYYSSWEEDIIRFDEMWDDNHEEYGSDIQWIEGFKKTLE